MCSWPMKSVLLGPGAFARVVSRGRQDHRSGQKDRRAGDSPGLRLPERERSLCQALRRRGHRLHRSQGAFDRGHGRQDRLQEAGAGGQGQHDPGLERCHRVGRARGGDCQRHWLPRDDQGLGRRRRQGPARGVQRQGSAGRFHRLPERSAQQLWRRPHLHREICRAAAPHRNPGGGRLAGQRGLPERARVLDPAAPPEGDRRGAFALHLRCHAQSHGRAGGGAGQGGAVPERRHGGVRGRQGPGLLLPGNEHPPAGGAPGHRVHHRAGSGGADDPRGRWREAAADAGRCEAQWLGHRVPHQRRRPVPQLPALHRPPGALCAAGADHVPGQHRRRCTACAWTRAWSMAARSRCFTTR